MNILLGGTGSVAAIKYWKLYEALRELGDVKCVLTEKAKFFADKESPKATLGDVEMKHAIIDKIRSDDLITDQDEWNWSKIGDTVQHIQLKDWADILVIAPLSANTLAKMVNGLCDNLLTSIYRAWPIKKPIVIAPAMNTDMWEHPITHEQLNTLRLRHKRSVDGFYSKYDNIEIVGPVSKMLACGTEGMGAMAPITDIVQAVRKNGTI